MSRLLAHLAMYDRPETAAATDRYWAAIQAHLGYGPTSLTRGGDVWDIWTNTNLLLSQTCGYPYRARLHGQVQLVGTPDYGLPDCPPGHYNSAIIVHQDAQIHNPSELNGRSFAYNESLSQSGWAAPKTWMDDHGIHPGETRQSGAHVNSARMVAEGQADFAALDAQTWRMVQRFDGFAANLRILAHTPPTPGLPYITAPGQNAKALFGAVAAAITDLDPADRDLLGLRGIVSISSPAYLAIPSPAEPTNVAQ